MKEQILIVLVRERSVCVFLVVNALLASVDVDSSGDRVGAFFRMKIMRSWCGGT